jgi:hypothetical protein
MSGGAPGAPPPGGGGVSHVGLRLVRLIVWRRPSVNTGQESWAPGRGGRLLDLPTTNWYVFYLESLNSFRPTSQRLLSPTEEQVNNAPIKETKDWYVVE